MAKKLSETQFEALRRMTMANLPLVRRSGGFWCVADDATDVGLRSWYQGEWSVTNGTQVVRAMEKAGLVRRTNRDSRDWCDPREVTDAGRMAYEEHAQELAMERYKAKHGHAP